MLKNYFKTSLRFLLKNKTYSLINITGLALGTLCCIYIILYVTDQYSYDKQQRDAKDIYRIVSRLEIAGDKHHNATASPPIAPAMKRDFGEVIQYTRIVPTLQVDKNLLNYKEKFIYEDQALYADSTLFDMFNYHFIYGNPSNALKAPYTLVLMKSVSDKLFGSEDPLGKTITIENSYGKENFKVTGVIDESLGKTQIQANMFLNMNSGGMGSYTANNQAWAGNNYCYSFIKLRPGAQAADLETKLPAFLNKYGGDQMRQMGMTKSLELQPLLSVHTTSGTEFDMIRPVSSTFLNIMILIAVLIQVIACINFMNLSTARATKRAKEVGVRKVIGAGRYALIKQFLAESMFLSFLGILIALPLLLFALPYLNQITQADIQLTLFRDYRLWIFLVALMLMTGLIAGSYPAFYLSAFQANQVIKGNFSNRISAAGIRRTLVVFQFVLSIVLICSIIIVYSQLSYIKNMDLGFDKKQKLIFSFYTDASQKKMEAFSNDLQQLSEVKGVALSNYYLGQFVEQDHGVYPPGGNMTTSIDAQNIAVDEHFIKTNGIQIIAGRDFHLYDSGKTLINETLCRRLGLTPEKAPGTILYTEYKPDPLFSVQVVGVMKDFNYSSLHNEIKPLELDYDSRKSRFTKMTVSVNSDHYNTLLEKLESVWHKNLSTVPFEYQFLDDVVQKQYESEQTLGHIINSFTLMAILISSLGLFGLASFSAEQRSKEIGIRKVLGASVSGIVQLLSKDFLKLVFLSLIIATPIAWWAMNKWLQGFSYRVNITWWMFALAGLIAILIA
ncbi:MAG TPA: ABC transporter permease, partial [Chitinophagaceae bacterium]|nr:ABC transporter permease [Chitinophagaceae bacterium]